MRPGHRALEVPFKHAHGGIVAVDVLHDAQGPGTLESVCRAREIRDDSTQGVVRRTAVARIGAHFDLRCCFAFGQFEKCDVYRSAPHAFASM